MRPGKPGAPGNAAPITYHDESRVLKFGEARVKCQSFLRRLNWKIPLTWRSRTQYVAAYSDIGVCPSLGNLPLILYCVDTRGVIRIAFSLAVLR
jgi:hypothetical protein